MIEIKNLSLKFRKKEILKNASCILDNGIYGILGPNGAGKTTLMRCIAGLYDHYSGEIRFDAPQVRLGYLPQHFGMFPDLSVTDNMSYFAALKGVPKKLRSERTDACLKAVNMEPFREKKARELSGGMLRRAGIAQALLNDPEILLLDEPTVGLDPEERMHFKEIIASLRKDIVVMISTHIVEDIEACCRSILVMKDGEICFQGSSGQLRKQAEGKVYEAAVEDFALPQETSAEEGCGNTPENPAAPQNTFLGKKYGTASKGFSIPQGAFIEKEYGTTLKGFPIPQSAFIEKEYETASKDFPTPQNTYIEKEYEKESGIVRRFLSSAHCPNATLCDATIKDGYLCIIRNI